MKKKILIVEDEAIIAEDIRILLENEGYEVVGACSTVEKAIELAREKRPDLAIVDIVLEKGDGVRLAEKIIKEMEIPVIFVTAYSDKATLERVLKVQPYSYVLKPFEARELLGIVKIALDRAESERRLRSLSNLLGFLNLAREVIIRARDSKEISQKLCREIAPKFSPKCALLLFENGELSHWELNLGDLEEQFLKALKSGNLPACLKESEEEAVYLKDRRKECKECPLKEFCEEEGMILMRFISKGVFYGALYLSPPEDFRKEDLSYIKGFSRDLALAFEARLAESEATQTLSQLQTSLSFLQAVLSSMREMVFAFDEEMRFTFVHAPDEEALLVKKEDIIGKKPEDILPEDIVKTFKEAFEENKKGKVATYEYTVEVKGKRRWYSVSQSPLLMGDMFSGAVAIVREVTERKKLELQLLERERIYRSLFENVPVGLYRSSPDGKILEANPAFLKILGFESLDELKIGDATSLFAEPGERERWRRRLEDKGILDAEYKLRRKDGRIIWVRDLARVTEREGKKFYEGAIQDITKIKESEEKLRKYVSELRRLFNETVAALGAMVEMRDPYTAGHQLRVAELAVAIAQEMKLPPDRIDLVRVAGLLHDIGKLGIPAEILVKPGKLLPQEMELVKLHPTISYQILSKIEFPWPVAEVVYQHHERLDGSGYPRGLKGSGIMKEAKILAVADVVEAMSSHRPYRPAYGIAKALEEINRGRGKLYDSEVVEAALAVFKKGFRFRKSFFAPGRPSH